MGSCVARALIIAGVRQPIGSKNIDNLKPPPNSGNKSGSKITITAGGVKMDQSSSTSEFVCAATFFPVRRWLDVIRFLRASFGVQRQLKETSGLVRYGLRTDFIRKRYWTFSVWTDQTSLDAFLQAEPHAAAMRRMHQWVVPGDSAFVTWNSADDSINCEEGLDRLRSSLAHGARDNPRRVRS